MSAREARLILRWEPHAGVRISKPAPPSACSLDRDRADSGSRAGARLRGVSRVRGHGCRDTLERRFSPGRNANFLGLAGVSFVSPAELFRGQRTAGECSARKTSFRAVVRPDRLAQSASAAGGRGLGGFVDLSQPGAWVFFTVVFPARRVGFRTDPGAGRRSATVRGSGEVSRRVRR